MSSRRVRPGSILEIVTSRGLRYLQYIGRHSRYGDVIAVLGGWFDERPCDVQTLALHKLYYTFYPARLSVRSKATEVVGYAPLGPAETIPHRLRREGAISNDGQVLTWIISDGNSEYVTRELTADEEALTIASLWNHEYLKEQLEMEWVPSAPRGTMPKQPPASPHLGRPSSISHYLYFPNHGTAAAAATECRTSGAGTTIKRSGIRWLLVVRQMWEPESLEQEERRLTDLARRKGGEYDGHEVALHERPADRLQRD